MAALLVVLVLLVWRAVVEYRRVRADERVGQDFWKRYNRPYDL